MSENLAHPRNRPPAGWGFLYPAGPETAILAAPPDIPFAAERSAALRVLAEEHAEAHGGLLHPLASPRRALLIRLARDRAEALAAPLRLLLGEDAVTSFALPDQAEALSERLAATPAATEPVFAVALAAPRRRLLRLMPPLSRETLDATLAELEALPRDPPPLLFLPLAFLRDDTFLRFAAAHPGPAGGGGGGMVATAPFADLLAAPDAAHRAAAALARAGHRLGVALPARALSLFDLSTISAPLLVTGWDASWQNHAPALARAGAARVLATGVDSSAALAACRAAGVGAIAGRAAARLAGDRIGRSAA